MDQRVGRMGKVSSPPVSPLPRLGPGVIMQANRLKQVLTVHS
jgi:hypothetical protein